MTAARTTPTAAEAPQPTSLADLPPAGRAVVTGVESDAPLGRRLRDLGFVPGTEVRVLRRAPLGDPLAVELRGYQICLRRRDARRIRVRPLVAADLAPTAASALARDTPLAGAALPRSSAR